MQKKKEAAPPLLLLLASHTLPINHLFVDTQTARSLLVLLGLEIVEVLNDDSHEEAGRRVHKHASRLLSG